MNHGFREGATWRPRPDDPEYVGRHQLSVSWSVRHVAHHIFAVNLKGGAFHG